LEGFREPGMTQTAETCLKGGNARRVEGRVAPCGLPAPTGAADPEPVPGVSLLGGCSFEATYPEGHRRTSGREPDDRASGGWEDEEQTGFRAARAV